jgi:protein TonB
MEWNTILTSLLIHGVAIYALLNFGVPRSDRPAGVSSAVMADIIVPEAGNGEPRTAGGERQIANHELRTPNPELRTPNPEPRTPNSKPRTPNPELQTGQEGGTAGIGGGAMGGAGAAGLSGTGGSNIILSKIRARIEAAKEYPNAARKMRMEGRPVVMFEINADGSIRYVKVARSSGTAVLDDAAMAAVRRAAPLPYYEKPITLAIRYEMRE